ncbi:hypothetical protein [Streptomyces sp. DSM 40484]|uniref:hypothetical protein n=1 Tax=Streptomyces kroppenstedtii TaxID=3051181 RepID=UPI0028D6831A|nr:hypothetical protein [Streptomyces sp. DSM 40484]
MLAGQTQAMLGPDLPDRPPVGIAEQEGFVHSALALAVHARAHSWAEADLGAAGVPGQDDIPHPGEQRMADAFDALGRLVLPHASPEGWTATLVTDLAHGDKTLETAVKIGKYILHPTFLLLVDDTTRLVGEAQHNLNVQRLQELTDAVRQYAGAAEPATRAAKSELPGWQVERSDVPGSEPGELSVFALVPTADLPDVPGSEPGELSVFALVPTADLPDLPESDDLGIVRPDVDGPDTDSLSLGDLGLRDFGSGGRSSFSR